MTMASRGSIPSGIVRSLSVVGDEFVRLEQLLAQLDFEAIEYNASFKLGLTIRSLVRLERRPKPGRDGG